MTKAQILVQIGILKLQLFFIRRVIGLAALGSGKPALGR